MIFSAGTITMIAVKNRGVMYLSKKVFARDKVNTYAIEKKERVVSTRNRDAFSVFEGSMLEMMLKAIRIIPRIPNNLIELNRRGPIGMGWFTCTKYVSAKVNGPI